MFSALDIGNKQVKMISGKLIKRYPSYFIDAEEQNRALFGKFDKNNIHEYVSSKDSEFTYIWGTELNTNTKQIVDTIAFEARYDSNYFKVLVDLTLGELARHHISDMKDGILELDLISGIPTNDFIQNDTLTKFGEVLKGDHLVSIDGESYYIRVNGVYVLPQNMGTFFDLILDDNGEMIDSPFINQSVSVADLGGGTILLDHINNMTLETDLQKQLEEGSYTLFNAILRDFIVKGYRVNAYEIEQFLRKYNDSEKYMWSPNGVKEIDVTDIVMKQRKRYTRKVVNKIISTYKAFDRTHTIIVTGGSSNLLIKDEFEKEIPNCLFVENAELANIRGFYKYGLSQGLKLGDDG